MTAGEPITAHFTNLGVPLTSPATLPTVTVWRVDTGAEVVSAASMTEIGGGNYKYVFTGGDPLLNYVVRADGDPLAAGQVSAMERYAWGDFSGHGGDTARKLLANRAVTTELGGGAKRVSFKDDDDTTELFSIDISADGLERTRT